jgi:membrane protein implicated in regulation of membrane protease activity
MDGQWWLVWLGIALVAGLAEIFTLVLVFAMVAGGALAAALVAGLTGSWIASVLAFAVSTGLLLVVVRPPLLAYARRSGPADSVGIEALIGRRAEVIEAVDRHGGQVKLAGEIWSARADDDGSREPLETGSTVYVVRIDGAAAVVSAFPNRSSRPALPDRDPSDRPEN